MNPDLAGLLTTCMNASDFDSTPWLILADWLDEHDDSRGAMVRLHHRAAVTGQADRARLRAMGVPQADLDERGWHIERTWIRHAHHITAIDWPTRMVLERIPTDRGFSFAACADAIAQSPWLRVGLRMGLNIEATALRPILSFAPKVDSCHCVIRQERSEKLSMLRSLPNLRRLHINAIDRMIETNCIQIGELVNLRELTIMGYPQRITTEWRHLAHLQQLESLILIQTHYGSIPPEVYRLWASSMPLRKLHFPQLPEPKLRDLAKWSELRVLELPILTASKSSLSRMLGRLTKLEQLTLNSSRIEQLLLATQKIAALPRLRTLNLGMNWNIQDRDLLPLKESVTLEEITLRYNRLLTDHSLDSLREHDSLRWLDMQGCVNLSAAACQRFRAARPDVTLLADHV